MTALHVFYPGEPREEIDDLLFALPEWYASGYNYESGERDIALDFEERTRQAELLAEFLTERITDVRVVLCNAA